jgi:hypothetical protein
MGTPQHSSRTHSRAHSPSQSISPIPANGGTIDPPLFVGQGFADFKVSARSSSSSSSPPDDDDDR